MYSERCALTGGHWDGSTRSPGAEPIRTRPIVRRRPVGRRSFTAVFSVAADEFLVWPKPSQTGPDDNTDFARSADHCQHQSPALRPAGPNWHLLDAINTR